MLGSKPLASLSPTLLARKGQARPAMRRAGLADLASIAHAGDDLGWNDMGEDAPEVPLVLLERRRLVADLAPSIDKTDPSPPQGVEVALSTVDVQGIAIGATDGRRAAFTLRLDAERHLRLRLASAARGRSAQKLVTDALDALLAAMPEVAVLRAQLADTDRPIVHGK